MFKQKMLLVKDMKKYLDSHGFVEVITPTLRREAGALIHRIKVINHASRTIGALRDSHELQLRWLLTKYDSVYEIGSCFREEMDEKSNTNAQEFLLMELFTAKHNLSDLIELTMGIIHLKKPDTSYEIISIADYIRNDLCIDLFVERQERLFEKLKEVYRDERFEHDYEYVLHYIEQKIEPLSKGKLVFFTDYPECTCSYANIKKGNIISRFELFANGIELANGFDDECCAVRFRRRNQELPIFENEENAVVKALESGYLPSASSGVGIGIERLCMFIYESGQISDFLFPSNIF